MNGAANNTAVNGRAKKASPIATPASPASASDDRSRTPRRYATANSRFRSVVGAYGRNTEEVASASGEATKRTAAARPTRRSNAVDPSTYTSAALPAATTASVARGSPNSHIDTAYIAAGTGLYFG